ncbi:hypothetical protein Taro_021317, partial [Colocasia esculenta]|nr:hypothetical protein [Colocasia esculenta]
YISEVDTDLVPSVTMRMGKVYSTDVEILEQTIRIPSKHVRSVLDVTTSIAGDAISPPQVLPAQNTPPPPAPPPSALCSIRYFPPPDMASTYRVCLCFRRRFEAASNEPPEAIREVFDRYAENGVMGPEQLRRFLVEVQGEDDASAAAAAAGEGHHLSVFHLRKGVLSLDGFFRYLFREDNQPLLSHSLGVHQDMTAPLSHYFIYTGHNSYLTGNQLSSDCSDVPIIGALKKGVRVIELDLWPNSAKDDVHVLHGRTLTAPVELIKCLKSVKEHAFSASPYPVILTLEDHLPPNLQAKVAKMVTQTFGNILFRPNSESPNKFPSPEDLKMRIVIQLNLQKSILNPRALRTMLKKPKKKSPRVKRACGVKRSQILNLSCVNDIGQGEPDHYEEDDVDEGDQSLVQNEAVEYKQLIAITAIKRKRNLSESLKVEPNTATRISLNEQMFEKATISHGMELIRFTQQNLLRLFPKSTRFDSSNYNPFLGWMYGAQMVAFNMQGHGRELWLMQGMFRANGACGYVRKPDMLLQNSHGDKVFDPKLDLPVKRTLKVGIAGAPADCVMKSTRAIEDSWTPVWNEEFIFPLTVPEIALLRVEVHEYDMSEKDDFGGQTCLPVWELRSGIRAVPLYDHRGDRYKNVKLLMHFELS